MTAVPLVAADVPIGGQKKPRPRSGLFCYVILSKPSLSWRSRSTTNYFAPRSRVELNASRAKKESFVISVILSLSKDQFSRPAFSNST